MRVCCTHSHLHFSFPLFFFFRLRFLPYVWVQLPGTLKPNHTCYTQFNGISCVKSLVKWQWWLHVQTTFSTTHKNHSNSTPMSECENVIVAMTHQLFSLCYPMWISQTSMPILFVRTTDGVFRPIKYSEIISNIECQRAKFIWFIYLDIIQAFLRDKWNGKIYNLSKIKNSQSIRFCRSFIFRNKKCVIKLLWLTKTINLSIYYGLV